MTSAATKTCRATRDCEFSKQLVEQLANCSTAADKKKVLAKHQSLLRSEIVAQIADTVREQIRVDVTQALRMADAALVIAKCLGNPKSSAIALRTKANVLYAMGEQSSIKLHQRAATLFRSVGETTELARTLSTSIQPLLLAGEYRRAFAAAEKARAIFAEQGNTWRLARLEINVGNIHHRQDRFAEALACYERAYQDLPADQDPEGMAAVLSNMATCHISLNDFPKALATYQQARQFCEQHSMPSLVMQADYNIASLFYLRGEYSKAIERLRSTETNSQNIGDSYHAALCDLDLSEIYLELNLSSEAGGLAKRGYDSFRKLGMGYESAKCLVFSALAATQQGHGTECLKILVEARKLFVAEDNQAWTAVIDLYRALTLFNEGKLAVSQRHCISALRSFHKLKLTTKVLLAEVLLGRICLRLGDSNAAHRYIRRALKNIQHVDIPQLSYQVHLLSGDVYSNRRDQTQAYNCYQTARKCLETLRSNLRGEGLKISFLKNRSEVYENLVDLCLQQNKAEAVKEAFNYVEQAKSRCLIDLLLRPATTLTEAQGEQEERASSIVALRKELNWYYKRIENEQLQTKQQANAQIAALEVKAQDCENKLLQLLQETTSGEAAHAGLKLPTALSLDKIRHAVPDDSLLVEYFQVRDRFLACLVGQKSLEIIPLSSTSRVSSLLRLLQLQLSKFRLDQEYVAIFADSISQTVQAHLRELYEELILPVNSRLNARHLTFIPHGILHYIPFHALFDGSQYLIDRYTISYAPSASIYALCQARNTPSSSSQSLVLGIPDEAAPVIEDEVRAISRVLQPSELFIGQMATEKVLRERAPHSRIIHIASHGRYRQDNPMFSAIRLGDSYLSLFDLYQLKLPAELITLSGCSTGLNVVAAGDELIGLARGLLQAGARSLLLTLWDVNDRSTADFMTSFYGLLQSGLPKAEALRLAMLRLRAKYPLCFQWAPFILVG